MKLCDATRTCWRKRSGRSISVPAEQVLQRRHDRLDPGPVAARVQCLSPGAAVQQLAADLVVLLEQGKRLVNRSTDLLPGSVTVRVVGERCPQALGNADVVNDQAAGLVEEGPVHPGDGLHQPGTTHRLVHVHRVERWRVEAREPHVPDDDEFQRIVGVLGPLLECPEAVLVPDVAVHLRSVGRRPGDDDLDLPAGVVVGVPLRSELDDLVVEARRRCDGSCRR